MTVLAVNAGSSSLKFALYPTHGLDADPATLVGNLEGLESATDPIRLTWRSDADGQSGDEQIAVTSDDPFHEALAALQQLLTRFPAGRGLQAVAHRVVHGGATYREPVRVTDDVLATLRTLCPLAPLHQPHNLEGVEAFRRALPDVPQIACFDTAFHADIPPVEHNFALPRALTQQGIRRYGFHGLSYQYLMSQLLRLTPRATSRVVMAHLGNGSSLCAAHGGKSAATTMGFSALDGLMMGTRSGSLDAGVLLHLMEQGWDHDRIQTLLYKQSGLLGVSGLTADMRRLRASELPAAREAIAMYTHRVVRETGALTACLGGLDVLAFTGGIGEHDAALRADVAQRLSYLGVTLNPAANYRATGNDTMCISAEGSTVQVWVIPTDEGRVAAQEAMAVLQAV
jgi:acetate kinase